MNKKTDQSINAPKIVSVLDISTGHITKNDDLRIKAAAVASGSTEFCNIPVIVYGYPEGYFLYVPQDELDEVLKVYRKKGMSTQFCKILRLAAVRGIKYVQFDCDGTTYADLKTFNW